MRMCLTNASLEHNGVPMENRPGCTTEVKTRTPQRWAATTVCTQPPSTGEVEAVFESPTSYLVNVKGTRTDQGQQKPFSMSMRYKFVAADCGGVKPIDEVMAREIAALKPLSVELSLHGNPVLLEEAVRTEPTERSWALSLAKSYSGVSRASDAVRVLMGLAGPGNFGPL